MSLNSDFPLDIQILNISTNMGRIGGWVADSYESKQKLILRFLEETESFISQLNDQKISPELIQTIQKFEQAFANLKKEKIIHSNRLKWAERALTWANILQHRAKLA